MIGGWFSGGQTVDVDCEVDIEQTQESFHAHAVPVGVDIRPGDVVLVHGAPSSIAFGERMTCQLRATVTRAGLVERLWTEFAGLFALTELYHIGFEPKEVP